MREFFPHAHYVEFVFVLQSAFGLIFSLYILRKADQQQYLLVQNNINGFLLDQAGALVMRELWTCLTHAIMFVSAVAFLFLAPPDNFLGDPNFDLNNFPPRQSYFGLIMWLTASLTLILASYSGLRAMNKHDMRFNRLFPFKRRYTDQQQNLVNNKE